MHSLTLFVAVRSIEAGIGHAGRRIGPRRAHHASRWRYSRSNSPTAWLSVAVMGLALLADRATAQQEFSPESPEVKAIVAKGLAFLDNQVDPRSGGEALVGLAYLKSGAPVTHPRVQSAIALVRKSVAAKSPSGQIDEMYSPCVQLLFLLAVDPKQFRPEIDQLLAYLLSRQKEQGAWGYQARPTGDTSMTQYAVLALWELSQAGIEVPVEVWERVANWLLRTQDPDGSFGYQGNDPGTFQRAEQTDVRHSMVVAGLGSLLICARHLGLEYSGTRQPEISAALSRVEKNKKEKLKQLTAKVDPARIAAALEDGDRWMHANYAIDPPIVSFKHYYLYTLERYESFRELASGQVERYYAWYDDGVRFLARTQNSEGGWVSGATRPVDTAFAILFLLRSTQKSLGKAGLLDAGTLVGGRGLPKDLAQAQMRDGAVLAKPLTGPAEKLLSVLDNPADPAYLAAVEGFRELTFEADEATLDRQAVRLRQLAGSPAPEARLAAVQALARARDLDNVPTLIYALSDPDPEIVAVALAGLRFVSRKFDGLGTATIRDEPSRQAAIERWKAWYLSLRPEAKFERD